MNAIHHTASTSPMLRRSLRRWSQRWRHFVAGCNRDERATPVVSSASAQATDNSPPQANPQGVNVLTAKTNPMRREVELSGTVEGHETAKLMSKIDGYVGEVSVNIGDPVRQGDLLAQLDLPELEDEVERRRRMVEQAEALVRSRRADVALAEARRDEHDASLRMRESEQERIARLVRRGSLNQQQLDEATYAVESVVAMRSSADANIAATKAHLDSAERSVERGQGRRAQSRINGSIQPNYRSLRRRHHRADD